MVRAPGADSCIPFSAQPTFLTLGFLAQVDSVSQGKNLCGRVKKTESLR